MGKHWIVRGREAQICVLVADNAPESHVYAAGELRHYLSLMTSVSIPLMRETSGGCIAVGDAARAFLPDVPDLGYDGFAIRSVDGRLGIVGGARGVIYGVYEFLERLGCRFFTPLCEKIPSVTELPLPDMDVVQRPTLEYRQHNYRDFARNPRFAVKRRLNAGNLDACYGGGMNYAWFVHTFQHIISPDEYYDSHPEYFSMVNGERLRERPQLCLTNPDVLAITVEKVRAALRDNPFCRLISVSQNDWYNPCQCPACAAVDAEEGSCAGSLIRFVNAVAAAIEDEFPEVIIDTLAYMYSRPTPKLTRPRHNVCVRLCSIEACFAHPLATCDDESRRVRMPGGKTTSFIEDLTNWGKICDRLYIWDYTTCFAHYPAPYPNWNVLQPNMQAFVRNGVKGVFEQGCGAAGGSTDLNELRAYLISKLLWDADCDIEAHMMDFLGFFYGKAAPFIREYIRLLTDFVERENVHIGFNDQCDKPYLVPELLDRYDALFDKAEAALGGDPVRLMRVGRARLSIRWVRIKNRAMQERVVNPDEVNQFYEDWRAHGLTRIDEWVEPETTLRALQEGYWRGIDFMKNFWDEGKERI